jgi:flagellar biosynthesis/type III secretory pathway protein FliH
MGTRASLAELPEIGRSGAGGPLRLGADAAAQARGLLERAERQAQAVMEAAGQKAAAVVAEGHREGYVQGQAEGMREGQARAAALAHSLEEAVARLRELEGEWQARAEQTLVTLAVGLAERILQRAATEDPEALLRAAAAALAALPTGGEITLRVAPGLAESLEGHLAALTALAPAGSRLRVRADEAVRGGGCVVEGPATLVDATYATQLAEAQRRLEGASC